MVSTTVLSCATLTDLAARHKSPRASESRFFRPVDRWGSPGGRACASTAIAAIARPGSAGARRMNFASDNAAGVGAGNSRRDRRRECGIGGGLWRRCVHATRASRLERGVRAAGRGVSRRHRHRRQRPGPRRADAAVERDLLPRGSAYPRRRMRRAGILHRRRQAGRHRRRRRQDHARARSRGDRPLSARPRQVGRSRRAVAFAGRPKPARSIRSTRSRRSSAIAHAAGLAVHMDGARFANALVELGCSPAQMSWRAGVDALSSAPPRTARWAAKR